MNTPQAIIRVIVPVLVDIFLLTRSDKSAAREGFSYLGDHVVV